MKSSDSTCIVIDEKAVRVFCIINLNISARYEYTDVPITRQSTNTFLYFQNIAHRKNTDV